MSRTILLHSLLYALLWWVLTEGRADSWGLGMVAVAVAVWASLRLPFSMLQRINLSGAASFLAFFLWNSLDGGVQVSQLALRGRRSLQPAFVEFELDLPPGAPRYVLLYSLGLMPGTLGVELAGERLRFHVLDERQDILPKVQELQSHIARMFGVER